MQEGENTFVSVFNSTEAKPLLEWNKFVRNGHIKRLADKDIGCSVIELQGSNIATTYITCPADPGATLDQQLPILVLVIKSLDKYFSFEALIVDDTNVRRRFRASNFQSTTRVKPYICSMPMKLDDGWNVIHFNLKDFVAKAYHTTLQATLRVQVHANCRVRRIYFTDQVREEKELPPEFRSNVT